MWKCYHYILPFSGKYSFQRLTVLEIYNSDVLHLTNDDGKIGTVFLFPDLIWEEKFHWKCMVLQRMAPEAGWHMSVIVSMLKKIVKSFKNFVYKEAKNYCKIFKPLY